MGWSGIEIALRVSILLLIEGPDIFIAFKLILIRDDFFKSNYIYLGSNPANSNHIMKQELIIHNVSELQKISKEINIWGIKKYEVSVQIDNLTIQENKMIEDKVKKYYGVCGCGEGKVAGIFTLIIFITLLATGVISIKIVGIGRTIGLYFLIALITMLISKIYALLRARTRLTDLVLETRNKLLPNI